MSREIRIEVMRLAKILVRDLIKGHRQKMCCYSSKEIDTAAKKVVEQSGQRLVPQAWDNCKMRWEAKREAKR